MQGTMAVVGFSCMIMNGYVSKLDQYNGWILAGQSQQACNDAGCLRASLFVVCHQQYIYISVYSYNHIDVWVYVDNCVTILCYIFVLYLLHKSSILIQFYQKIFVIDLEVIK